MKPKQSYNRLMAVILTVFFALSLKTGVSQILPNCPGTATLTAVRTGCFDYEISVQTQNMLSVLAHTWYVNGPPVPPPTTFGSFNLFDLTAGIHTICLKIRYVSPEGVECESEFCTEIDVPTETADPDGSVGFVNVYYCPLGLVMTPPMYNPCDYCGAGSNYFELFSNSTLVLSSGDPNACTPRPLGANDVINCYDIRPDGRRCLKGTVSLVPTPLSPNTIIEQNEIVTAPCGASTVGYHINANYFSTEFLVTGPNNFLQGGPLQQGQADVIFDLPGDYVIELYDLEHCEIRQYTVTVVFRPIEESQCTIAVANCGELNDQAAIESYMLRNGCTNCHTTFMNSNIRSHWIQTYNPGDIYRTVGRIYTDTVNCKKCTITFLVPIATDPAYSYQIINGPGETIYPRNLPDCLQEKTVKVRIIDSNGASYLLPDYHAGDPRWLGCANAYGFNDPIYLFYDENDPCCYIAFQMDCPDEAPAAERKDGRLGAEPNSQEPVTALQLSIIPNPCSSVFRVTPSNSSNAIQRYEKVEIRDANGKTVLIKTNITSETELDVSKFTKGVYYVTVIAKSSVSNLKLVVPGE